MNTKIKLQFTLGLEIRKWNRKIFIFGCLLVVCFSNVVAQSGKVYRTGNYELWLPTGVDTIRGLVSCVNYFSGAQLFDDIKLREMASRTKLGLYRFPTGAVQDGKNHAMDSLAPLATLSGHPEIRYACLIPHGLSAAGWDAGGLVLRFPSRMIACISEAGFESKITGNPECLLVPVCGNNKGEDNFYPGSGVNTKDDIENGRQKLAPWTFQISLGCGHDSWCHMDWVFTWIEEITKVRLPAKIPLNASPVLLTINETSGWLGKLYAKDNASGGSHWSVDSARVWNYASCPFDPKTCYWFPSQRAAESWQYSMTHNNTMPPSSIIQSHKRGTSPASVQIMPINRQLNQSSIEIRYSGPFSADLLTSAGKRIATTSGYDKALLYAQGANFGSGMLMLRIEQKGSVVQVKPVNFHRD